MSAKLLLIASRGRCGSHMLQTALAGHPQLDMRGELFNHRVKHDAQRWRPKRVSPEAYLARLLRSAKPGAAYLGFIGHYDQLHRDRRILPALQSRVSAVLLLSRQNLLRQFCSHEIATRTRRWVATKHQPSTARLRLNLAKATAYFRQIQLSLSADKRAWRGRPLYAISYEQLIQQFPQAITAALALLGVEQLPLSPQTFQQEHRPLTEIIYNYGEVARVFAKSPWAKFLD